MLATKRRLAIVSTHPIQYQSPWFRALAAEPDLAIEVLFCHRETATDQARAGFGVEFAWDLPLLEGYPHRFLRNVAQKPTTSTFGGLDTPEIGSILARREFDAVLVNGWHYKSAWQTFLAAKRYRVPVMARSDSHLHTPRSVWKHAVKAVPYRLFIPRLDACLAVGKWSREYFAAFGATKGRIFTVPHTIDDAYFRQAAEALEPNRDLLRNEWGFSTNQTVFLFVAKFVETKRPFDFIEALGTAAATGAPVAGLMVGDGALRSACEERASDLGAPITFAGFLNQTAISRAYVAADALVLCSETETWGMVVNEAMTFGRPCFVSDQVGCGPDLIHPGQTGDVFEMGNVPALSRLMQEYTADPARSGKMSSNAKAKIQEYSLQTAVSGIQQALDAVVRRCR